MEKHMLLESQSASIFKMSGWEACKCSEHLHVRKFEQLQCYGISNFQFQHRISIKTVKIIKR